MKKEADSDEQTRGALTHLGLVAAVVVAGLVASYSLPVGAAVDAGSFKLDFDRLKPWIPGDSAPLARLFESWGEKELPAFAGAGGSYRPSEQVTARVEERLGRAVAANLGEEAGVTVDQPGEQANGQSGEASPAVRIAPSEYEGIDVEIENRAALRSFYAELHRTARDERDAITRIAHYGDSSIATDLITHTVRRRMQHRFGDAGHGFLLIARGSMPWGHRDVRHGASSGWQLRQLVNNDDRSGLYGFGGVAYRAASGGYASFGTDERGPVGNSVSRFDIYFRRDPNAGGIRVRVDGGEPRVIDTSGEPGDAVESVRVPDGDHSMELRPAGGGQVRLYGVAMERDQPGVVYDSLGMVGARARRLLNYDSEHIAAQMRLRDVDLLVLGFGGNEADDPLTRMPRYEGEFVQVIRRMRAGRREMACLVFGPLDQAGRDEYGRMRTMPTVPLIVEAQRRAARAEGCAFFNTFEAMGGEGGMVAWTRMRPRLAMTDFRHATPAGYEVIGNMFYKALLKGFAEYLDRQR